MANQDSATEPSHRETNSVVTAAMMGGSDDLSDVCLTRRFGSRQTSTVTSRLLP